MTTAAAPVRTARSTGVRAALVRRWPTGLGIAATTASLALISPLPDRLQVWVSAFGVLTAAVIYPASPPGGNTGPVAAR